MIKSTVIIPNYNGFRFLADCMEALSKQSLSDFYTLVVDNGSSDESLPWLRQWAEEAPEHRILIENKDNLGFSAAVNQGIKWSMAHGCLYSVLLNNDTKADPDFLRALEDAMEADTRQRLFAVSSQMLKMHDPAQIDDAGDQYTVLGWQFQRGLEEPAVNWQTPAHVFSACAGAAAYRNAALQKTGLFDTAHFAYLEDVDISFRAQLYGYQVRYEPKARCLHVGSGTSGSKYNAFKVRLSARNSWYLLYKNMPVPMLILNALPLSLGYLVKLLYFVRKGFGKEYLEGLQEGFRTAGNLRQARFEEVPVLRFLTIELRLLTATLEYVSRIFRKYGNHKNKD